MVAMSAKLEPTPQPCATVLLHEDEIRSVEGPRCYPPSVHKEEEVLS